jgi:hypothetical protein
MVEPMISVVIPTRNRPDTLEICLSAMGFHRSNAIEIVVQDNSTNGATFDVVKTAMARDPRIRYEQAPFPTSQRHNFELGLAAAKGRYLTIIGDDDGFAIGSLDWLVDRLQSTTVDAVRWNLLHYVWPSLSTDGEGFMDFLPSMVGGGSSVQDAAALAGRALRAKTAGSWDNLLVYHGMISRNVYERMKQADGVFFRYPMPDVYAHNVIPGFCTTYLQVNDIISIYGVSGHSAGASWTRTHGNTVDAAAEGNRWMRESVEDKVAQQLPWQPDIRTLRYHDYAALKVAESYGMLPSGAPDIDIWIRAIIAELSKDSSQLGAWYKIEPKAPFDELIIASVKKAFPRPPQPGTVKTDNKKTADPRLPSIRVRSVDQDLSDDVVGAMRALADITGADLERYGRTPQFRKNLIGSSVLSAAKVLRRLAPGASARFMNSPLMPGIMWRYLRMQQFSGGHISRPGYIEIINRQRNSQQKKSSGVATSNAGQGEKGAEQ